MTGLPESLARGCSRARLQGRLLWRGWRRPRRAQGGASGRAVARSLGLALLVTSGAVAFAQSAPAPAPPSTAPAPTDTAAAAAPATPSPAPSGSAAAGSAPKGAVMGYAYKGSGAPAFAASSGSTPHHRHLLPHHPNEAVATFTGFEMLADGGSRLFVQLSRQVEVGQQKGDAPVASSPRKAKKAHPPATSDVVARLKFVLKGTEVVNPMNEGALVTVHFNTPVVRARLMPAGHDLDLVVDLRADVTPQMKIVPAKDNGAMLQIDFPQGAYLPAGAGEPPPGTGDPAGAPAPAALPSTPGRPQEKPQPAGAYDSMESK